MTHHRDWTAAPFRVARRAGSTLYFIAGVLFLAASVISAELRPSGDNLLWLAAALLTLGQSAALWAIAHPDAVAGYQESALGRELSAGDASAEVEHERLIRADDLQMAAFFERTSASPDVPLPLSSDGDAEQSIPDWELESEEDRRWMPPLEPDVEADPTVDAGEGEPAPAPAPAREPAPQHHAPEPPLSQWAPPTSSAYPDPTLRAPVDLPSWASAARQHSARHRGGAGRRRLTG